MAAAYAGANSYYTDPTITQQNIENAVYDGSALGNQAFSQTYELESDVIGTYITKAAGYDPVQGVRFFARPESPKEVNGQLSFWAHIHQIKRGLQQSLQPSQKSRQANLVRFRKLTETDFKIRHSTADHPLGGSELFALERVHKG